VELPRLQPLYEKYKDAGFEVIAIEAKRDTDRAKRFIEEKKLSYTFLETGVGKEDIVRGLFAVHVFPTSYIIDESGRVVFVHIGFSPGDEETVEKEILRLLES